MQRKYNNIEVIDDGSYRAVCAHELAAALERLSPKRKVQISCGLDVVEKAAATDADFKVHVLDPQKHYDAFDLVVIPGHEPYPKHANIIETCGLINHVSPQYLSGKKQAFDLPQPSIAVLLGGKHVGGNFTVYDALRLADVLNGQEYSLLVTTSKRTESMAADAFRDALKRPYYFYDFSRDGQVVNPYEAMLASAERIVVTADSARMLSEAASSGKSVQVYVPLQTHFSYVAMKDYFIKSGYALDMPDFLGVSKTLAEAEQVAKIIAGKL